MLIRSCSEEISLAMSEMNEMGPDAERERSKKKGQKSGSWSVMKARMIAAGWRARQHRVADFG